MAVTFGLLAALLWGLSDFLISITGRSFGILRAMLYAQCVGVLLVGAWIFAAAIAVPLMAPASSWTAAILAAPIGVAATLVRRGEFRIEAKHSQPHTIELHLQGRRDHRDLP